MGGKGKAGCERGKRKEEGTEKGKGMGKQKGKGIGKRKRKAMGKGIEEGKW